MDFTMPSLGRLGLLILTLSVVVAGEYTGKLSIYVYKWRNIPLFVRILLTIIVGWPFIAYVSPVLIKG